MSGPTSLPEPIRASVLTCSDRSARGEREDAAGPRLVELLASWGVSARLADPVVDDRSAISNALRRLATECELIVTTGGTGLGPRDVTPEATRDVIEREAPGFTEEIRRRGAAQFPRAILSRAVCGTMRREDGETLVLNLPGSPNGAVESLTWVRAPLLHGLKVLSGGLRDCRDDPA